MQQILFKKRSITVNMVVYSSMSQCIRQFLKTKLFTLNVIFTISISDIMFHLIV